MHVTERGQLENVTGCESGRWFSVAQNRVDVLKIAVPRISGVIVSRGQGWVLDALLLT
jgi:F0F1-type ATP synthase assembly protein I